MNRNNDTDWLNEDFQKLQPSRREGRRGGRRRRAGDEDDDARREPRDVEVGSSSNSEGNMERI